MKLARYKRYLRLAKVNDQWKSFPDGLPYWWVAPAYIGPYQGIARSSIAIRDSICNVFASGLVLFDPERIKWPVRKIPFIKVDPV